MTTLDMDVPVSLAAVLDGLVPLHVAHFARCPAERDYMLKEAGDLAATIAKAGDRLISPRKFSGLAQRRERGQLLTEMATCLALSSEHDGGVTWGEGHWCNRPHDKCPNSGADGGIHE